MGIGGGIFLVILIIGLIVIIRLAAGGADHGRIRSYVAQRGGAVQSIEWAPFGRGWFGEQNDRIYRVLYVDSDGNEHEASCKTSLFSGVYFTEDRIIRYSSKSREAKNETESLHEENERLREELRRLKGS
jgi:hypothetical protein